MKLDPTSKEQTGPECYECRHHVLDKDSEFGSELGRDSLAFTKCELTNRPNCARWHACSNFKGREEEKKELEKGAAEVQA